jgi:hypothetical protein
MAFPVIVVFGWGHKRTKTTLDKPHHSMDDPPHVQKAFSGSAHSGMGQPLGL